MSYCRWSSDDYQCDVYCYDAGGVYITDVARFRLVPDGTLPPSVPHEKEHLDSWWRRNEKLNEWAKRAERRPIGLPHDGEAFEDPDAASAAARLQMLKDVGYNVPQYAIDSLREEAADEEDNPRSTGEELGEKDLWWKWSLSW